LKILSIIPARANSKGIKHKNIIDLCGKPLIQYSIEQSLILQSKNLISKTIVSTDSEKIKEISQNLGAEVPFLRPKNISGDKSKSIDFILHAINFFEKQNIKFDLVLLLQPTSPLRTLKILIDSINLFNSCKVANSLISCYKEEYVNDLVMYKKSCNGHVKPINKNHNKGIRRQEHGEIFVRNGAIYITKVKYLIKTNNIICDNPLFVEMKKSQSLNIDTLEDLKIVKNLLCK
jgi:CMP-N-acetylneuraminic acid synthetase